VKEQSRIWGGDGGNAQPEVVLVLSPQIRKLRLSLAVVAALLWVKNLKSITSIGHFTRM